jgi:hypothetical protein
MRASRLVRSQVRARSASRDRCPAAVAIEGENEEARKRPTIAVVAGADRSRRPDRVNRVVGAVPGPARSPIAHGHQLPGRQSPQLIEKLCMRTRLVDSRRHKQRHAEVDRLCGGLGQVGLVVLGDENDRRSVVVQRSTGGYGQLDRGLAGHDRSGVTRHDDLGCRRGTRPTTSRTAFPAAHRLRGCSRPGAWRTPVRPPSRGRET